jgi:hypothetical protein
VDIGLGNHLNLDGSIIIGASLDGTDATCSGCFGLETVFTGYLDSDPLGMNNNGRLSNAFDDVVSDNDNSLNAFIVNNAFTTSPNDNVTFTAGDYYLTEVDTAPNTEVTIDDSAGPVRFFVDGPVNFQPKNGLSLNDAFGFQIYVRSSDSVVVKPNSHFSFFLYAPNATVRLQPGTYLKGSFWAQDITLQPNTEFFVDSSMQDRWLSNELVVHSRYEQRLQ